MHNVLQLVVQAEELQVARFRIHFKLNDHPAAVFVIYGRRPLTSNAPCRCELVGESDAAGGFAHARSRLREQLERKERTLGHVLGRSTTGSRPFRKQLLKKISPKLGAIMQRKPESANAYTAGSHDEPQAKFAPVTAMRAVRYGTRFMTK